MLNLSLSPEDDTRLTARAAEAGLSREALIQHWVEMGPLPTPKGYRVARERETAVSVPRWARRFVWTLHRVPGRIDGAPLAVRRRILDASDLSGLIETPGGRMSFDLDELESTGHARGDGYHRCGGPAERPATLHGMWGCDLALDIWDHPPTPEEQAAWIVRRKAESVAIGTMNRKKGVMLVWVTFPAGRKGDPDVAVRCRARRTLGQVEGDLHRGDLDVELPGYREPEPNGQILHRATVDVYDLMVNGVAEPRYQVDNAKRVALVCPTPAQLRAWGRS